ncbi:1,6-anhydro-N-acetylmuramyl-L-alanine amidase AmpD [Paraburkholderia caballeronis]|uniref:1,6-anhydro-N-acetylmuramyl-L-alanine amidase AmpD n=1 Tax=Paraburkholderia caballeronis TaxID=416943 RepID=A0A1H7PZT4_9BURK|nr:1,6-anhydro-N-acetylmuramyl-L-alanine amidase AmpD [Paraburkholderia caballeronis]PXW24425.1 AmpD protein [Paraburkholderia caballeronis]PXX00207.1 AmpD protein [Paraburkholderia caballeronis]RAJ97336.1 AmpD protein [Paraburkholderia caballeronis]TDV35048.1 AmpD protein [Paraburkholderia caballeronis]SEB63237.1 AmpD protein [Paraburkholderia caballeronis]
MSGPSAAPFAVDAHGWVPAAHRLPSPNFEARPAGAVPSLIVVHNISLPPDTFGGPGITDLFLDRLDCDAHPFYDANLRGVRVSSHFVIRRDGVLEQYVSCDERAWHAGLSNFFGRERCNDFSIGIELEGSDTTAFEAAQYRTLAALVQALVARYPVDGLAGHSDIAPGRKTDPGPHFDWARLQRDAQLADSYFPYRHPRDAQRAAP